MQMLRGSPTHSHCRFPCAPPPKPVHHLRDDSLPRQPARALIAAQPYVVRGERRQPQLSHLRGHLPHRQFGFRPLLLGRRIAVSTCRLRWFRALFKPRLLREFYLLIRSTPALLLLRLDGRVEAKGWNVALREAAGGTCATIASTRCALTNFGIGDLIPGVKQWRNSWVRQAVFPGNNGAQEAMCPHCRRVVSHYSYAFFATHKSVSCLQDKIAALESEIGRAKKNLAHAKAEAEQATARVGDWCTWARAAKSSIQAMPPSSMPHAHTSVPPHRESEIARSRSPRQPPQVRLARLEFAPEAARQP